MTASITTLEDEHGLSTADIGVVLVMYDVAYLLGSVPAGHFCARNIPVAIGAGLLVCAFAAMAFGMSSSLWQFAATRLVFGFGAVPLWVLGFVHVDNNVGDKLRVPRFHGRLLSLAPLGFVMGIALAAVMFSAEASSEPGACKAADDDLEPSCVRTATATATLLPKAGCDSWRYCFLGLGAAMVPLGVWMLQSRVRYSCHLPVSPHQLPDFIEEEPSPRHIARMTERVRARDGMRQVLGNARWLLVVLAASMQAFAATAAAAFTPRFLEKQLCQDRAVTLVIVMAFIPCAAVGMQLGGWLPHKHDWGISKQLVQCIVVQTLVCPTGLVFLTSSLQVFIVVLLLAPFILYFSAAPGVNIVQRVVSPEHKAISMSLSNVVVRALGNLPGPIVLGALIQADALPSVGANYVLVTAGGHGLSLFCWLAAYWLHRAGVEQGLWRDGSEELGEDERLAEAQKWRRVKPKHRPESSQQEHFRVTSIAVSELRSSVVESSTETSDARATAPVPSPNSPDATPGGDATMG
eukprot:TRINITY_DN43990_c0_g1_i1.p1 TRINITY_DN43990_c0_g1~~TRINITY_DN43990_c0_g1_i1.p1  ORF type:complete len:608 (+),score=168.03 TRINITY_DN43990_c0_g1_i1:264-1826(+)